MKNEKKWKTGDSFFFELSIIDFIFIYYMEYKIEAKFRTGDDDNERESIMCWVIVVISEAQ